MQIAEWRPPAGTVRSDACFIHVHVPRTGGTTLRNVLFGRLSTRLKSDEIFLVDLLSDRYRTGSVDDFEGLSSDELRRLRFVSGHAPLRFAEHVPRPFTFAVLREPVDRSLSVYWYCFHNPQHPAHAHARSMSPVEFITGGWGEARNGQARYLSGYAFTTESPSDDQLLDATEIALERLSYIGFFDSLRTVVRDMCRAVGTRPPLTIPRTNAAPRQPISRRDLIRIEACNAADIALYKLALERWGDYDPSLLFV